LPVFYYFYSLWLFTFFSPIVFLCVFLFPKSWKTDGQQISTTDAWVGIHTAYISPDKLRAGLAWPVPFRMFVIPETVFLLFLVRFIDMEMDVESSVTVVCALCTIACKSHDVLLLLRVDLWGGGDIFI
jgi:hypothetical protein